MLPDFYDPNAEHGGLEGIKRYSATRSATSDTLFLQAAALEFWESYKEPLRQRSRIDPEVTRAMQLRKVARLVDLAYQLVPFYRDLYHGIGFRPGEIRSWFDFESLPVITKDRLSRAVPRDLVADPAKVPTAHIAISSGSSGVPLRVYNNDLNIIRDFTEVLRFYEESLSSKLDPADWIYTLHHAGLWFSSLGENYRTFRLTDLNHEVPLGRHLGHLRPRVLTTLPSYLPIIKAMDVDLKDHGIEVVLTNSETSTRKERDDYSAHFGVPVLDEYSSSEIGLIATECPHQSLHIVEDGVLLELIEQDSSGFGSVVCTDLHNQFMPLIRYDHGDIARFGSGACGCGSRFRSLSEINGRRDDAFRTAEGTVLPTGTILAICDEVAKQRFEIAEFRLIQRSFSNILVMLRLKKSSDQSALSILASLLTQRFHSAFGYKIDIDIDVVEKLPDMPSYKRRTLVRENFFEDAS